MFDRTVTFANSDGSFKLIITAGTEGPKTLMLRTPNSLSVVTPEEVMNLIALAIRSQTKDAPQSPPASG